MPENSIRVSVPGRPGVVPLLRGVVASWAGRLGCSVDDIEDLRLAVTEACADLLELDSSATVLNLRLFTTEGDIVVLVWTNASTPDWPRADTRDRLTWQVLSLLTDTATMIRQDGGPGIRLHKRQPAGDSG